MNNPLPLLGITGYSGSGKTTLLEKLLPQLIKKGLRVSVIKHSHHNAHVDREGKDSWRMKEAGSAQVIMAYSLGINDRNASRAGFISLFKPAI